MVNQPGMSKPSLLPLPRPISIDEYDGIAGMFCYIIEHYGYEGISCLIARNKEEDTISLTMGDWKGNTIDLDDKKHPLIVPAYKFISNHATDLTRMMSATGIGQGIFYFVPKKDGKFILVDLRTSLNKFVGPGMLRDIFGEVVEVQNCIKITHLDDAIMKSVREGVGAYSGSLILKPSMFRSVTVNGNPSPLYVEITR